MNLREKLAELEHEQWMAWSKAVANEVSFARLERWRKMWCPYSELTEEQKDQDRKWADKVLQAIKEDKTAYTTCPPHWYTEEGECRICGCQKEGD